MVDTLSIIIPNSLIRIVLLATVIKRESGLPWNWNEFTAYYIQMVRALQLQSSAADTTLLKGLIMASILLILLMAWFSFKKKKKRVWPSLLKFLQLFLESRLFIVLLAIQFPIMMIIIQLHLNFKIFQSSTLKWVCVSE